jgi:hypothetical protein
MDALNRGTAAKGPGRGLSPFLGGSYILPRIFEGRTEIEMWACSECGHVEFFMPLN